ncbi:MAG: 1-acyl-sn-glycerol-3-phosphate acyltransferase [Chitinophagaceae bacterium]|nr:1-acyl-sn-glycerol-3-phosphate acyltransferase [Chitinophagaceae bacterium]
MLYRLLWIYIRFTLRFFCKNIVLDKPESLRSHGPLMLAANHPNSFLDAVIINALFEQPVWSLARGDVFRNKFARKILHALRIMPVYRVSEGVENLSSNYDTFSDCIEIFKKNGIVLIFSEGRCINEWHLRPLKKGTARLAISCWEKQIPVKVLPVGINYNSFRKFGKNVFIHFGEPIESDLLKELYTDGAKTATFNRELGSALQDLVYDIDATDLQKQKRSYQCRCLCFEKYFYSSLPCWVISSVRLYSCLYYFL